MTMLSVILPASTLAGKECIDLTALDYDNVALFDHHAHFLEKEDATGRDSPGMGHWHHLRGWRGRRMRIFHRVEPPTIRTGGRKRRHLLTGGKAPTRGPFEMQTPRDTLRQGSEAEVYLADVTIAGRTQTVASKMYFRSSTAKSELHFYEGLPRDDNILQVYGCYMDLRQRWCLAMEYCRHGNIRQSMAGKKFPRNGGFLHHGVTG